MDIATLIDKYGLSVVIIGFLAACVCGIFKVPIVKTIQAQGLSEKMTSDRIRNICIAIVAVLSVIGISIYNCVVAKGFTPFLTLQLYIDMLTAITFSQVAYKLYEGVGPVSLKKWVHNIIGKISAKFKEGSVKGTTDTPVDWVDIIQTALIEEIHMPMTDTQKDALKSYLEQKVAVIDNQTYASNGQAEQLADHAIAEQPTEITTTT